MYTCITGVSDDHRNCKKLINYIFVYYKYKSNIETILLHPETSITAVHIKLL